VANGPDHNETTTAFCCTSLGKGADAATAAVDLLGAHIPAQCEPTYCVIAGVRDGLWGARPVLVYWVSPAH